MPTPPRIRTPLGFPGALNASDNGVLVRRGPSYLLRRYRSALRLDGPPWWRGGGFRPSPCDGRLAPMAPVLSAGGEKLVLSVS